jgi:tyrosyl-tRNA synthetase
MMMQTMTTDPTHPTSAAAPSPEILAALDTLARGVEHTYSLEELKRKLIVASKKRVADPSYKGLRIKLGMDPTAPDIHLGHSVVLRKLRQFQDLGHQAVLIIGDYTAKIGDPTGRDTTRPILDDATIARNAQTYLDQAGRILDTSPGKLEVRHNSEWLSKLTFADVLKLTGLVTVQQMLHRENFAKRMAESREIMLSEFMYPIMQAYDSVVIQSDVELGGTDQTFNNLMGRQLMSKMNMDSQVVIVMPILVGLDGTEKMSKSKGNYVALTEPANEMFGKIMSIPDALMGNYFRLLTPLPEDRISSLIDPAVTHPRQAKDTLARVIVEAFHDAPAAAAASDEFRRRFTEGALPSDIQTITVTQNALSIVALLSQAGFAPSNSEARRLVEQGAVSLDDVKLTDTKATITLIAGKEHVLRAGKRRVCKVVLAS